VETHRQLRQAIRLAEMNQQIPKLPDGEHKYLKDTSLKEKTSAPKMKILLDSIDQSKLRETIRLIAMDRGMPTLPNEEKECEAATGPKEETSAAKMKILLDYNEQITKVLKQEENASPQQPPMRSIKKDDNCSDFRKTLTLLTKALESLNLDTVQGEERETNQEINQAIGQHVSAEFLDWLERLRDAIDIFGKPTSSKYEPLLQHYLRGEEKAKGLHISRTIDQYYYSSLLDTTRRDRDQVIRRYQCKKVKASHAEQDKAERKDKDNLGRETYKNSFQMGMVEQLWLWVIDDGMLCAP
jgi:hypothetical protein